MSNFRKCMLIMLLAAAALFVSTNHSRATEVDLSTGAGITSNSNGYTVINNVSGPVTLAYSFTGTVDAGVGFLIYTLNAGGTPIDGGTTSSALFSSAASGSITMTPVTNSIEVGYVLGDGGPSTSFNGQAVNGLAMSVYYGPGTPGASPLLPTSIVSGNLPASCTNGQMLWNPDGGGDAGALELCGNNVWSLVKSL